MEKNIRMSFENAIDDYNRRFCLYIDFPFCRSNCVYCIYNSLPYAMLKEKRNEYVEAVFQQLEEYKSLLSKRKLDSIYFGGGTPSLWTLDELKIMKKLIPNYDAIDGIKFELHPSDLDEKKVEFYVEEMKANIVSLGIQSFNINSCRGQKRIHVNPDKVERLVSEFHKYGVMVNIDLVALFNGDEEKDWRIFEEDIRIACHKIYPDVITSIPNYRTKLNYLEQIPRFRNILRSECNEIYFPLHEEMLSLNPEAINKYGKNDHWIATKEYWKYIRENYRYSSSSPDGKVNKDQITISVGGAEKHKVYSYNKQYIIHQAYNFETHCFEYEVGN